MEDEAEHPAQLISARGERAMIHQFLILAENMGIDRAGYAARRASPLGYRFDNIVDMMKAKRVHAAYLRFLTGCVEIAKLPADKQESKFAELGLRPVPGPQLLEGLSRGEEPKKMRRIFHSTTAYLRLGNRRARVGALSACGRPMAGRFERFGAQVFAQRAGRSA